VAILNVARETSQAKISLHNRNLSLSEVIPFQRLGIEMEGHENV
jgi:hypothetical protein